MQGNYESFSRNRFFGSLDGLRAISIIGVVWFHTWFATLAWPTLVRIPILSMGWFGVDVFFTISGFLITTLLIRERQREGRISLRDFYIRRTLRIWPLYYAVLGLYVILVLLTERGTARGQAFFHYLPSYLTYTYTWFGPRGKQPPAIFNFGWSLSVEEQFYLFWPFVLKFLRPPWPMILIAISVGLQLMNGNTLFGIHFTNDRLLFRILFSMAIPLCFGAILAQVLHWPAGFDALSRVLGKKWSAPAALVLLLLLLATLPESLRLIAWATAAFLVGACVIREDNGLAPLLRFRPLALIGVVSYGIYLFNTLVVKAGQAALPNLSRHHPGMLFPLILGCSTLVAWLSYRFFESPFLALKARFSHRKSPPLTAGVSVLAGNAP